MVERDYAQTEREARESYRKESRAYRIMTDSLEKNQKWYKSSKRWLDQQVQKR